MDNHYDLVILGGGCAGLSLGSRLAYAGVSAPLTLILEKNTEYTNDRTWCFWDIDNPELKDWVEYSWKKFIIKSKHNQLEKDCTSNPYLMISAKQFYNLCLKEILSNPEKLTLLNGQEILDVSKLSNNTWKITTDRSYFIADKIVDTRPNYDIKDEDATLWQSFIGHEIKSKIDLFDENVCVLMDFDDTFTEGLGFIYILPYSSKHALIEYTVFSDKVKTAFQLNDYLEKAISQYSQDQPFITVRKEYGRLPMGNRVSIQYNDPSYIKAGLFAGGARPSTGYAFQRIQTWAKLCAIELLVNNALVRPKKDPLFLVFMDNLFLEVIKSNPLYRIPIFFNFFAKNNAATTIRFLSDRASFLDYLLIIAAMPKVIFMKALPRHVLKRVIRSY
jgi:lycopene beta-cyclase